MRSQDIEGLPQDIHLLLVVGNDDGVDDGAGGVVAGIGEGLELQITGLAARGGAGMGRGQGLGTRERSGGAAAMVGFEVA